MAALTKTQLVYPATVGPTYQAAGAGGDNCDPGDKTFIIVKNASGSAVTVTIPRYPATDAEGVAETALTVSVPATTGERWIGPMTGSRFMNPATGKVEWTYSAVTSVTVAVITT